MDHLKALEVFSAVAREGSLVGASRKLRISPPSVTRIMNELEEHLGTPLLIRSTRAINLTETGSAYLASAERILDDVRAADDAAQGGALNPRGTLRLTASVLFGRYYVAPIISEYLQLYPDVRVEAAFLDRNVSLIDEGFDLAVRIGKLADSSLRAIRVGAVRLAVCGSPAYFERRGIPSRPEQLAEHDIIHFDGAAFSSTSWGFDDGIEVPIRPRISLTNVASCIEMAAAGHGLVRVLTYQIGPAAQAGEVQTVLDEFSTGEWPIHLVYAEQHGQSAKLRAFLDLAKERLRADPFLN